jgi:signal transduction histidine kinase
VTDRPPRPEEALGAYQAALGPETLRVFAAACEHEPDFLALVIRPSAGAFMVRALEAAPRRVEEGLDEWIVKVTARYLDSLCASQDSPFHMLSTLAHEDFLLGECPRYDDAAIEDHPLDDGTYASEWLQWSGHSNASFTNTLVRDYFIARELASSSYANRISAEYPQRWVLMFLAVLAPELVTRMAELRQQIEEEVTQRVQAALSHQLKRSAGAVRSNLKKIRSKLSQETFRQLHTEYDRILQESQFQIDLAERTGLWSAQPELRIEATSLLEAVDEVLGPLREKYPAVELAVTVPTALRAHADARLVREIVFCLAENAIHAVTYGGAGQRGRVEIRAITADERVRLEILDNGPGVHPGDTARVFEPRVTTKKGGEHLPLGTGMGLPIARRYARLMAGDVDIDTARSETCFFVELPPAKEGST